MAPWQIGKGNGAAAVGSGGKVYFVPVAGYMYNCSVAICF